MSTANLHSQAYEVSDTAEAIEFYYEKGWTDGLPVIPPTEASVRAMLDAAALEPGQEIAFIENRQVSVTAEKVAINAVMAGCKPEYMPVVAAAIRALGRTGSMEGLRAVLEHMSDLFERGIVSRKTAEASLVNFGAGTATVLLEYAKQSEDPRVVASLLEVLSNFHLGEALPFAMENLRHSDPEVRSKALKVIGASPGGQLSPFCVQL